ncbi:cell division protein ZapA [Pandoraea sp. XJJ-1]|jgi:cell division protein ZapA|uniref:Cell division protein ZapA n=2 Tax=Pandoraea TaxID=93217 RepID=A0A5E4Y4G9_9BURK|nr:MULTISPECIES: cell division protein ZapA [Pandoraea]MBN9117023.1 cell division protein ZapA [Pandoraea sp.]MDN4573365.1 cell division protein ZapA [Pandoraea cepalis]MDN4577657.1 cell division protein ZapA [Pandoraea cepalis]OJY24615.1 MAG: cell division protein ZapA [Pandoraea sp. 64-18]QBC30977.1 cell division protein ZapA [Pandoraea sp. XY-2]
MTIKQLEVNILEQSYRLACPPEHEADLLSAVSRVDAEMSKVRAQSNVRGTDRIAVMAALSLASELLALEKSIAAGQAFPAEEIQSRMNRMNERLSAVIDQYQS